MATLVTSALDNRPESSHTNRRGDRMNAQAGWLSKTVRGGLGLLLVLGALAGAVHAKGPAMTAPELDPGSLGSALTLLIGGAFLLSGRARRR